MMPSRGRLDAQSGPVQRFLHAGAVDREFESVDHACVLTSMEYDCG